MPSMIKLVVTDMDGSLLCRDQSITEGNLEAIHKIQELGIEFAIASGRDYNSVTGVMGAYGIECEAILGNGAQYSDKDGNILMDCYMDHSVIKPIVNVLHERNIPYMIITSGKPYTGYNPDYVRDIFLERGRRKFGGSEMPPDAPCNNLIKIDDFDEFVNSNLEIVKVEAFSLDPSEITEARQHIEHLPGISILSSFDDNIEVTNKDAQKGFILEKVVKLKGLTKEEVMVLGDGMNDISLFQCFPYSFAPSNAEKEIKELAYKIVSDCEHDALKEAVDLMIR